MKYTFSFYEPIGQIPLQARQRITTGMVMMMMIMLMMIMMMMMMMMMRTIT